MFKLNPDSEHVALIRKGLERRWGHCPCQVARTPETICPCVTFQETGDCHCKLFVEVNLTET